MTLRRRPFLGMTHFGSFPKNNPRAGLPFKQLPPRMQKEIYNKWIEGTGYTTIGINSVGEFIHDKNRLIDIFNKKHSEFFDIQYTSGTGAKRTSWVATAKLFNPVEFAQLYLPTHIELAKYLYFEDSKYQLHGSPTYTFVYEDGKLELLSVDPYDYTQQVGRSFPNLNTVKYFDLFLKQYLIGIFSDLFKDYETKYERVYSISAFANYCEKEGWLFNPFTLKSKAVDTSPNISRVASKHTFKYNRVLHNKAKEFLYEDMHSNDPKVVLYLLQDLEAGSPGGWEWHREEHEILSKAYELYSNKTFINGLVDLWFSKDIFLVEERKNALTFLLSLWEHDPAFLLSLGLREPKTIEYMHLTKDSLLFFIKHTTQNPVIENKIRASLKQDRYFAKDEDILLELARSYPKLFNDFAPTHIKKDPDFIGIVSKH